MDLLMLLPSGPDMVRGLYCIGPEARHGLKVSCYGIGEVLTNKKQAVGANLVFALLQNSCMLNVYTLHVKNKKIVEC